MRYSILGLSDMPLSGYMWLLAHIDIRVHIQYHKEYSDWVLDPINMSDLTLLFGLTLLLLPTESKS